MLYFLIDGKSVFDFLRAPRFHFLVFSNDETIVGKLFARTEQQNRWIERRILLLAPPIAEIFGADKPFSLLLRPDKHIALISADVSFERLKSYPLFD